MKKYSTDFRLWGLIFGGFFVALVGGILIVDGLPSVGMPLARFLVDVCSASVACAVIAWVIQAIAVVCGLRLTLRTLDQQLLDYDDTPNCNKLDQEASDERE